MTTAYRREPCGHERMPEGCVTHREGTAYWCDGHCPGFTYEPWPEIEALVEAARNEQPRRKALTEALANLRSEG